MYGNNEIEPIVFDEKRINIPNFPAARPDTMDYWILGCPECNIMFWKPVEFVTYK